jgi:hypothetical protein
MRMAPGQRVLRNIFTLRRNIFADLTYEVWEAEPSDGEGVLIKLWPFIKDEPSPVERNLWDRELRVLSRTSCPL